MVYREKSNGWKLWLFAGIAFLAWVAYWRFCTHPHFDLSDDPALLRSMGGMVGGVYEGTNPHTHALLSRGCALLSRWFPLVPWFSVMQLVACLLVLILPLLAAVRVRSGFVCLGALLFCTAFALPYTTAIMYTMTSALALGSGIWLVICLRNRRGLIEGFGMVLAAALMRMEAL